MISVQLADGGGKKQKASLVKRNGVIGLPVLTSDLALKTTSGRPFVNPTFGADMVQNVAFGGKPSGIHDGGSTASAISGTATTDNANKLQDTGGGFTAAVQVGMIVHNVTDGTYGNVTAVDSDTILSLDSDLFPDGDEDYAVGPYWTGVATQGAWDFADSARISLTAANNLDNAVFSAPGTSSLDLDNVTTLTGKVNLTTFDETIHTITIQFGLAGVSTGNAVNLNDHIDPGVLGSDQSFAIAKSEFGLGSELIDQMTVTLLRTGGGPKPTFILDDLQMEATGSPLDYSVTAKTGTKFNVTTLIFSIADTGTGVTGFPQFDEWSAGSSLTNGVDINVTLNKVNIISFNLKQLSDLIGIGAAISSQVDDGTNTYLSLTVDLFQTQPITLDSSTADSIKITLNDDLSGLLLFRVFARGWEEPLT